MTSSGARIEYDAARAFLLERKRRGVVLGLDRMRAFAAAIGNPQEQLPCIHVAGTNGKGSVAAMLEAILRSAGWRTGLYTSPHLVRLGERVQVDHQPLSDPELAEEVLALRPAVQALEAAGGQEAGPSYFEFMTGLALHHFRRRRCEISVIEVGVGGRLDATNLVLPEISVITSIGLDHCDLLGESIEAIAAEKAGIIKPGRPVVVGRVAAAAEAVIRRAAAASRSPLHSVREHYGDIARCPRTNLEGEYQRWNAATAALAAQVLGSRWRLDEGGISWALNQVDWPGRWQRLSVAGREIILDSSHNAEGAGVLDANLRQLFAASGRAPVVVTGVLGSRRAAAILPVVCRHAREVHLVRPAQGRACTFEELEALIPAGNPVSVTRGAVRELFPGPGDCRLGGPGDTIVVTGSIALAGEVLACLEPERGPSDSDLQDF